MPDHVITGHNTRTVGVSDKAGVLDQREVLVEQLLGIFAQEGAAERMLFEDVFFEVITWAGMHIEHVPLAEISRQIAQPLVALPFAEPRKHAGTDLLIGPQSGSTGLGVETDGFVDRRMVMVAGNDFAFVAHVQNGAHGVYRFGAIADNIAQAVDGIHTLLIDVRQHSIKGWHVAMDVADDCDSPHAEG